MLPRPAVSFVLSLSVLVLAGCNDTSSSTPDDEAGLSRTELIGKRLFFDTSLSEPRGMSCASCHNPDTAFAGNNGSTVGVAMGSRAGVLGIRNTPTVMYAGFAPHFAVVTTDDGPTPTGGQFLDGRVDTLAAQAKGPLTSPTEMNNPSAEAVVAKVAMSGYASLLRQQYGDSLFSRPAAAFDAIAEALQAFEQTARFHPFSSRYDGYIAGKTQFSDAELRGMKLFFDPEKGNCVACHAAKPESRDPKDSLFTDFTFDNLGVPRNSAIPANADANFYDLGLCGPKRTPPSDDPSLCGAFKVPTLRNVALKQAFMHNGYFKQLRDVIAFYATRDTDPARWYPGGDKFNDLPPAYRSNVNTTEVPYNRKPGEQPALKEREIDDLYAFLQTLTDQPATTVH
jgi:cytochrome c peroxidase